MVQRELERAQRLLLFLDYDGTLTPLVDHPSKAYLAQDTKRVLAQLTRQPSIWVVLISGRSLQDLKRMIRLRNLWYVGNHGLELSSPVFLRYTNPAARTSRPRLRQIAQRLNEVLKPITGAWIEDKGLTLSVHYRAVASGEMLPLRNGFYAVVRPYLEKRQVRVDTGTGVFEVQPPVRWNKSTMVKWLMARCMAAEPGTSVLPIYVGDDHTDEEAFEAFASHGITVSVGPSSPFTRAQYHVSSTEEVRDLLKEVLAVWKTKPGEA
ncbi:MAG: trehalose-phosphatase [Candidatus Omnitrophica bacterium]|nr:trehalose-phosphatase [Candidatus Omnitrophota bacterium]